MMIVRIDMRVPILLYVAAVISVAGCRRTETATTSPQATSTATTTEVGKQDPREAKVDPLVAHENPPAVLRTAVGTILGPDGTVAGDETAFKRGQPVYISIWLKDSPAGLQTSARWFDKNGKQIGGERKEMKGATKATFAIKEKLPPGEYRVEVYWGGDLSGEHSFKVSK